MKKNKIEALIDFIIQLRKKKVEKGMIKVNGKKLKPIFLFFFSIAIFQSNAIPDDHILRVELLSFSITLNDNQADIYWSIHQESDDVYYTIERSLDDLEYTPIGSVESIPGENQDNNYILKDQSPLPGISYYRLVKTGMNGQIKHFPASVLKNNIPESVRIYPNPSISGNIQLTGISEKIIPLVTVRDLTGKTVPSKLSKNDDKFDIIIDEIAAAHKGIFIIAIDDGRRITYQKLIIH